MRIHVKFFATLRQKIRTPELEVEAKDGWKIQDLRDHLASVYPEISQNLATCLVALDRKYADDNTLLKDGCEVAFFPPVSGGSPVSIIRITRKRLNVDAVCSKLSQPSTGSVAVFVGIVRRMTENDNGQTITRKLEYQAYKTMALEKMKDIESEIRAKWQGVDGVAIVQRIGVIAAGKPSVIIACASSHRDQGIFEAAKFAIDRLKQIVPIWKKEIMINGEEWVEGEYRPKEGD